MDEIITNIGREYEVGSGEEAPPPEVQNYYRPFVTSDSGRSSTMCTSRPSRYVSVINDNHLVSLMNFNATKVD
jgi:hypothetical protein